MRGNSLVLAVVMATAGCAGPSPNTEVSNAVAALTLAANDRNAGEVRTRGRELLTLLDEHQSELGVTRVNRLRTLTTRIVGNAEDLAAGDATPAPTATPSSTPTPRETEGPTEEPTPTPTRTREEATQAPPPTPAPTPTEVREPSPAPTRQAPSAEPEPEPEPEATDDATPEPTATTRSRGLPSSAATTSSGTKAAGRAGEAPAPPVSTTNGEAS